MAAKTKKATAAARAAKAVEIADRRHKVAQFALAYVPQKSIAAQLGVSPATISTDLRKIKEDWLAEAKLDVQTAAVRELQSIDRLETQMWTQLLAKTTTPDVRVRTALSILKCKERRAKMLGFDQPDLLDITISDERLVAEVIELREELGYDGPAALPG